MTHPRPIKRILLISPPGMVYLNPDGPAHRKHCSPPVGLAYLAAVLEQAGIEVAVIDVLAEGYDQESFKGQFIRYGLSTQEVVERARAFAPDLVGVSVLFSMVFGEAVEIAKALKDALGGVPVVMGGHHPTGTPRQTLAHPEVDYVLAGEADLTFPALVEALGGARALESVPALYYRENGQARSTLEGVRPAVAGQGWSHYRAREAGIPTDLDALPFPAWHKFPMQAYWSSDVRVGGGDVPRERYVVMMSTRGCPHACAFCSSALVSGYRGFRVRSAESIVAEIRLMVERYGIEEVQFMDDNFFAGKKRVKKLLRLLAGEFPSLLFQVPAGTEVATLDDELIDLMAKANFHKVLLSIEAGDSDVQKSSVDKQVPLSRVPEVIAALKSRKIETRGLFMIGFPGERRHQIEKTLALAKSLDLDDFYLAIVSAFPGTRLFDECLEGDLFVEKPVVEQMRFSRANIRLPDVTSEELEGFRRTVWLEAFEARRKSLDVLVHDQRQRFTDVKSYETAGFRILEQGLRPPAPEAQPAGGPDRPC